MKNSVNITSIYNNGKYLAKNADWHASDSPWKAIQIDKIIKRNKVELKFICEVGCGAGEIINQLSLKSYYSQSKFFGYEISENAFKLCIEKSSERVSFFKEDLIKLDKKFDIVLCIDVFEHIENYIGFLRALREKGKIKIFHIPLDLSFNSLIRGGLMKSREELGHLHHFTPDTALATLSDCGYEIIDTMYTPHFDFPPKSLKNRIARLPRKILYSISAKLMSTVLGGTSMMVLAK